MRLYVLRCRSTIKMKNITFIAAAVLMILVPCTVAGKRIMVFLDS